MGLILEKDIEIETSHSGDNNKLTLSSLLDFLQTVAGDHANKLHLGIPDLNKENDTWVLSRMRVEIERWPVVGEKIVLKTWPKGIDHLFAIRDFELCDTMGNVLVSAASYWLVIDKISKRPKMMTAVFIDIDYPKLSAIDNKLEKLPSLNETHYNSEITTSETEIDVNGHVNNVWYADWIMKTLPYTIRKEKRITSFEINYLSEVFVNEKVNIELGWSSENESLMLGRLKRNEKEVCRVKISFD